MTRQDGNPKDVFREHKDIKISSRFELMRQGALASDYGPIRPLQLKYWLYCLLDYGVVFSKSPDAPSILWSRPGDFKIPDTSREAP